MSVYDKRVCEKAGVGGRPMSVCTGSPSKSRRASTPPPL